MNRAVFLDRDGTVIEEKDYLHRVEDLVVLPGAAAGLKRLQEAGFRLICVTNQSGVGRGLFTMAEVEAVNARLLEELARHGAVRMDRFYVAPEAPGQPSRGRKPSPHFLFQARDEFELDLAQSYMIGDKLIDLECGWNAGVRQSILVRSGYGAREEEQYRQRLAAAVVVDDLAAATAWILGDGRSGPSG
jgi:D-glycero-D-manno-heptose 1,7-bisphosphate phosphatase